MAKKRKHKKKFKLDWSLIVGLVSVGLGLVNILMPVPTTLFGLGSIPYAIYIPFLIGFIFILYYISKKL